MAITALTARHGDDDIMIVDEPFADVVRAIVSSFPNLELFSLNDEDQPHAVLLGNCGEHFVIEALEA